MTKVELIRKLAKRAGVPDTEAKIFFEIFLQNASSILNPGEAINIKNFGFFQLRKGKIRNISAPVNEEFKDAVYPDLIVYTPDEKSAGDSSEMLIFNIPISKQTEFHSVDSYFSLSIGKPVIPLRGVKESEFFVQPTGNELRSLLESKVENLLSHSELIKSYTKGNEYLVVNSESIIASQFEFNWNEFSGEQKDATKDSENIPWEFGEDISRQIEEESILDVDRDESFNTSFDNKNVTWDFGAVDVGPDEDKDTASGEEETNQTRIEDLKNFKRVKSFTKEFNDKKGGGYITRSEEDLSWSFGEADDQNKADDKEADNIIEEENDFYKNYDEPVTDENGFIEVKNKRKTYDIELSKQEQEQLNSIIKEEEDKIEESDAAVEPENFYTEEPTEVQHARKDYTSLTRERDYYSRGKSTPIFFIALTVIVLVGAALFIFLRDGGILENKEPRQQNVLNSGSPVVIERTFEIPVTYPYQKNEKDADITLPVVSDEKGTEQKTITDNIKTSTADETDIAPGNVVKIKDYLFKEGYTYSVQVSSWKSRSKAESEVKKLIDKGHDASVERVSLTGRGAWYRVKIINLKTQAEAEKYLIQN